MLLIDGSSDIVSDIVTDIVGSWDAHASKKVYPFEADLEIVEFKSLAYLSHTIG